MSKNKSDTLKISNNGGGEYIIKGASEEEVSLLRAAFTNGTQWVRKGEDGRLENIPAYEELPQPEQDVKMQPFWSPSLSGEGDGVQLKMLFLDDDMKAFGRYDSPSIFISHLCGYSYSPENYIGQAEFLKKCGFRCMRSQRGKDGRYWEIWYLPGMVLAKGPLQEAIKDSGYSNQKLKSKVAVEFLRKHAQFGTLDVVVQRLAMVRND